MHPIFHITVEQIRKLRDDQARELLDRLCRAQIRRAGLDSASVHGSGDQRAADGGVDVLIESIPTVDVGGPLLRSFGVIQVKASPFGEAAVKKEMVRKGVLRPSIAALAQHRGAYLIASTRANPSAPERSKRVEAMKKVLSEHGLQDQIIVDFLGAWEIANWAEQFPPIVVWLRQAIGEPFDGWNSYGPWAYKEDDVGAEFALSDKLRFFPPDATEAMTDVQGINIIRSKLKTGQSVRLVGLSGVGKTRFAQALFDPRIETEAPALLADHAIYTDISNRPDPSPEAMVEALKISDEPSVLIVDNCGQQTHSALVERKGRHINTLGLLTIELDVRDEIPDDTAWYRLEASSDEVLRSVLHSHHPNLTGADLSTVIAASEGNARVAFAIASTSRQSGDLATLRDDELLRRIFQQKYDPNEELFRCAQAASLVYSFDGIDISEGSEMALLSALANVAPRNFRANMVKIKRRGLLQERGKMRALLPHAISNRLAALALEELHESDLEARLIPNGPARMRASFANRLNYLHKSQEARTLVGHWLAVDSCLGNLASLSDHDFLIFQRIAPVNPPAALAAIERFSTSARSGDLHEFEIDKMVQIAHSIAYEANLFDRCVTVLVKLARLQAANKTRRKRSPENLKALFQAYASGTLAPPEQREAHLSRLLASSDLFEREVGVDLLISALNVRGFRNPGLFRFGAHARTQGWRPPSWTDYRHWYERFLALAEPLALQQDDIGKELRAALGRTVRGFIHDPLLMQYLERMAPEFIRIDGWLPSLKAVRDLLRQKDLNEDLRVSAKAFEQCITPKGLREKVLATIAMRDPFDYARQHTEGVDPYALAARHSVSLGRQLGNDPALLLELLPRLLTGEIYVQARSIGQGVASVTTDARPLLRLVRSIIEAAGNQHSLNLTFAVGLFKGWHDTDPALVAQLLDEALEDPILRPWFPALQLGVPLDAVGAGRIVASILAGHAPLPSYQMLGFSLKPLDLAAIAPILDALLTKGTEGSYSAIDALSYVVFDANDRVQDDRDQLGALCRDIMARATWPPIGEFGERLDHEISQILAFGVKYSNAFEEVRAVLRCVEAYRRSSQSYVPGDRGNYLFPILHRYPEQTLTYLNSKRGSDRQHRIDEMVLGAWVSHHYGPPRSAMEPGVLVRWCAQDPQARIAFATRICPLELPAEAETATAVQLYVIAPDKAAFMQTLLGRCIRAATSNEDLPNLTSGIRLFETLPLEAGSPEDDQCKQAIDDLQSRISWWNEMLGRTRVDRDEGFE